MPSILGGLDTVQQALTAQQFALSVTQRNVANVNNPSYTRQEVVFNDDSAESTASGVLGVELQANRNRYLDYSINNELQALGQGNVEYDALKQIDGLIGEQDGAGLQEKLSDFFNSFSSLSSNPTDMNLRQQVLTTANALAQKFRQLSGDIQQVQTFEDQDVNANVDEANSILARIADLNKKIGLAGNSPEGFTLRDERQTQLENLSNIMNFSYYETESGSITVTTTQGDLLVLQDASHKLSTYTMPDNNAFLGVSLDGTDITASIKSGTLGGLLDIRDNKIAGYLSTLDDMAAGIIARVNEVHAQGIDLNGDPGEDFFTPFAETVPGSNAGAARAMSVALTDGSGIAAASSTGGVGNNENAKLLAGISDEELFGDSLQTASVAYASLIYRIGADEKEAEENVTTENSLLEQMKNQRDAVSGVDLNEEAINLMKYQKAYQASARYANVLDSLSQEILNLVGA